MPAQLEQVAEALRGDQGSPRRSSRRPAATRCRSATSPAVSASPWSPVAALHRAPRGRVSPAHRPAHRHRDHAGVALGERVADRTGAHRPGPRGTRPTGDVSVLRRSRNLLSRPHIALLRDPSLVAAVDGIHGDPARPWTVEELGRRAGLSRATFARRFTAMTGRPPLTYLTWWRMTLAARLLRASDAPLPTIARQVGYTSPFAFAHAFKREYGETPGRYRQG
ncbi:MAG: helix-turn-helix domain-containing protein [Streptosporangiales bacterium]|nr:helix-turn-helix domain-containing protein [Streptosporangiales bacterium]